MAENKLEGFEDFDNILGEGEGAQGEGGAAAFAGELDNLLGGEAGAKEGAAEGGAGAAGGDSELDSFFEDLSTIDDLEVLQEDEPAAPAAAAPAAAEPEAEAEPEPESERAPRAAAAPERPRPLRQARQPRKRGFFGRLIRWIILLAILGGGGYFAYLFFFPDLQPPWQVMEQQKSKLMSMVEEKLRKPPPAQPQPPPPPPPPPVAMQPQPRPKPRPAPKRAPAPPKEMGPWSIQVATCFFPSCLESYRGYLEGQHRSVLVRDKASQSESLEIYSISNWSDRDQAQQLADRVNREQPLEGHAFIFREEGGYRISMGAFSDLGRANIVKDALNQQYQGQMVFATRAKAFPYKLQSVLTGRFPTRDAAEASLTDMKNAEPRLKDAFVTRNR
jgi:cell division septation protein DedD